MAGPLMTLQSCAETLWRGYNGRKSVRRKTVLLLLPVSLAMSACITFKVETRETTQEEVVEEKIRRIDVAHVEGGDHGRLEIELQEEIEQQLRLNVYAHNNIDWQLTGLVEGFAKKGKWGPYIMCLTILPICWIDVVGLPLTVPVALPLAAVKSIDPIRPESTTQRTQVVTRPAADRRLRVSYMGRTLEMRTDEDGVGRVAFSEDALTLLRSGAKSVDLELLLRGSDLGTSA